MTYKYRIFGYQVKSDIPLPCFESEFEQEDVRIRIGSVPATLDERLPMNRLFQMSPDACIFEGEDAGRFMVTKGCEIVAEPEANGGHDDLVLFILGAAFGYIMLQRDEFPIHGSMIEMDGTGLLLMGHSGAGKSSLAAGFVESGGKLVSDDLSRLVAAEQGYIVEPGFPSQRIWGHTAEALEIGYDPLREVGKGFGKYYIEGRYRFVNQAVPVHGIIEIIQGECQDVMLEKLSRGSGLSALIQHTYHEDSLCFPSHLQAHFGFMTQLAARVPVYRLTRPRKGFTVAGQIKIIQSVLNGGRG